MLFIYDDAYNLVGVVDKYKSLIWTTRYYTYGDFELQIALPSAQAKLLKPDYYILRKSNDYAMIIESIEYNTDGEGVDCLTVKGRSLLSICDRRIIWQLLKRTDYKPSSAIALIVKNNFAPDTADATYSTAERAVKGFKVTNSYTNADTDEIKLATSWGDNVLDKITEIAKEYQLGIKITLDVNAEYPLNFIVYKAGGSECIFAESLDNIKSCKFTNDKTNYKNVCIVAGGGETEGVNRWSVDSWRGSVEPSGLKRRECFLDASSINAGDTSGVYQDYLFSKGKKELSNHKWQKSFECENSPNTQFVYKGDYNIGSRVQVSDKYNNSASVRVTEIIESWSETGYTAVPTFEDLGG